MILEVLSEIPADLSQKTPVLFVHGAYHDARCWSEFFLPYFAQNGYPSYAVSLQGHGSSQTQKRLNALRISDYVKDVAQVAGDMPIPPILIGHSMGGLVVQKYLEKHCAPSAVLMSSLPVGGIFRSAIRMAKNHPSAFFRSVLTMDLHHFIGSTRLARESFFSEDIDPEDLDKYFSRLQNESFLAFQDMLILNLPHPRKINTPLLVLGAANDRVFSTKEAGKTAKAYDAQIRIMENMAHDMMLERDWRKVADHILDWLKHNDL
ncbi:MAG: alpha/beta fold hydrolase [Oscillospiraceae bacterium]|nr:alpha/beta fold hydrolase [Oscillospiraceae bacterium]